MHLVAPCREPDLFVDGIWAGSRAAAQAEEVQDKATEQLQSTSG